jgi:hypothetical protein
MSKKAEYGRRINDLETVKRILDSFNYDPVLGSLTRKECRGRPATHETECIMVDGVLYRRRQVAWIVGHGKVELPPINIFMIDPRSPRPYALVNLTSVKPTTDPTWQYIRGFGRAYDLPRPLRCKLASS